jgi:xanthine dehydrogenase YagT iron-sulfur-binding subunit
MQDNSRPAQEFPNAYDDVPRESMELRQEPGEWPISRRDFVLGASALIGVSTLVAPVAHAAPDSPATEIKKLPVNLTINGESKQLTVDPRTSLLDLLREDLKMTGTKKGCDHGQCGACTVLCNGRRINSCLALAVSHDGDKITTVEGLAKGEALDPVQQAFLEHDGYQCGYCTPGQIISAVALLDEARKGSPSFVTADLRKTGPVELTDDEIRERMSGNICRCGAYPGIVAAVRQAYGAGGGQAAESSAEGESDAAI